MYSLIRKYEGCQLEAYKCPKGYWTIGIGNRYMLDGTPVKEGDRISYTEADELLDNYVKKEILPCITEMGKNFTDDQKEALYSLIYNVGPNAFRKSKLRKAIMSNDYAEICRQWDFGFVNNLKGLFKRRTEELYLYIKDI